MSFEAIEKQLLACRTAAAKEALVRSQINQSFPGKVSRSDFGRLQELLKKNKRHEAAALGLAMAVTAGGDSLLADLRRRGVLRASRYGFKAGPLRELVRLLSRLQDALSLNERWIDYLESVKALYELAPEAKRLRDDLITSLSLRRGKALKSFLVLANQAFTHGAFPINDAEAYPTGWISAEEIASAVSRIIALIREETGLNEKDFSLTDEQALNDLNGTYSYDLSRALRLEKLYEAETLVDGLPYRTRAEGQTVIVESIDPDVEKSVRLGYVQMNMQVLIRISATERIWAEREKPLVSLFDIFKGYYESAIEQFVKIKTHPLPRITFGIPMIPNLFDPLANDSLFREELLSLLQLSVEDYEQFQVEPFEVAPGILSIDLFKINRLFGLVHFIYLRELEKVTDHKERKRLALHSVIVVMRKEQLLSLLGAVLSPEKADKVLEFLVLDESREFVDLQYSPFLKAGKLYLLAPSLISSSNLVRNIAFLNRLNENRLHGDDPMQAAVAQALRDAGFKVGMEVQDSKKSKIGDTDLVAYRDGVLYLFECKNAYHPCNAHEMRNSYEHIRKAGKQLTLRQQKFRETAYQAKVWQHLGWDVPPPETIRTAVLIANRVFTGACIEGHPVRQSHEFINVVARGEIRGPEVVYHFWDGDTLSITDLDRYLSSDGLIGDHLASLEPINYRYNFGAKSLVFESWKFDSERSREIYQRRYREKTVSAT